MKTRWFVMTAISALALAMALAGCGGNGDDDDNGGATQGRVQLFLADAPIDAQEVNITISRIDVSRNGVGWTTIRTFTPARTINILDYTYDGVPGTPDELLLADSPLDAGTYTQIRLILTSASFRDSAGVDRPLALSSEDTTGLKLIGTFTVAPGSTTALLVDFDAQRSIVATGAGTYRLKPTVRVVPIAVSGSIRGTVAFKDAGGAAIPVPANASVEASVGGVFVASSPIVADGTFSVPGLPSGTYTLALAFPEGTTPVYVIPVGTTAVVTAGSSTNAGTLTATPSP